MDLENDTISLGGDENYFPKIDLSKIGKDVALNDYWGFLEDDGKKLKAGEENRRGRWEWIGDKNAKDKVDLSDSMSNVWVWWQHFFGDEGEEDNKVFGGSMWLSDVWGNWKAY